MLTVGNIVTHETHGMGIVTEVWGVFLSCRECFRPVTSHGKTECCGVVPAIIGGKGIFDVEFSDGKTRSIHERLLTPVLGEPKYTRRKAKPCPECEYEERTGEAAPVTHTCDPLRKQGEADELSLEEALQRVICGLPLP